ncbi:hypothetical protein DJ568_03225 [Mucilaginibacter hurinus]|uniref:Uncharacterized protein n=1 Tax=Mucilaginibacter hurinus TaxID=2201324 RepID=A0A367GVP4_9SPHI|nr:hypothetical protein [Mucilaginibacter hurinus]RCH56881.1 hypothetical protein DJ568_03225 [Mucilaginibacter hurinus]
MAETTLFDNFERTDTNRDNFQVQHYAFLNTSAVPEAENGRRKVLSWAEGFTLDAEFLRRFRSKINKQHSAALLELFIFNYFKSHKFPIQNLDRAEVPTPDFKIEGKTRSIYIECTRSSNSGTTDSIDTLQSLILDSFKNIDKQQHFINISWLVCSDRTPSLKKIRHFIREFIKDKQRGTVLIIDDAGWKIQISLLPASPEVKRGIGFMEHPAQIVTPHLNVLTALNDKRPARYKLDQPYIIALLSEDIHLDYLDMDLALFDGAPFQDKLPIKRGREMAFFIGKQHLINTSVSGVLLVQQLSPYSSQLPKMMLYHHPNAKYPLDPAMFNMPQKYYEQIDEDNYKIVELNTVN